METVVRTSIIYIVILVGLRILGKRELAQLSPFELVILLLIPELVSQSLLGEDYSLTTAIIGLTTIFSLVFIVSVVTHLSAKANTIVNGAPAVLVQNGKPVVENLNKERVSTEEIVSELHKVGLERIEQAKWVVLEADGRMSIVPYDKASSVQKGRAATKEHIE